VSANRRIALKVIGGAALPAGLPRRRALAAAGPRVLSRDELALLDAATERLIPADEHAGGARAALVAPFLDESLVRRSDDTKARWRRGLSELDRLARAQHGAGFVALPPRHQDAVLTKLAVAEASPQSAGERFFVELKDATIRAYYTSEVGLLRELEYRGNQFVETFRGCTHPEHRGD
jgi:hypothetical protein